MRPHCGGLGLVRSTALIASGLAELYTGANSASSLISRFTSGPIRTLALEPALQIRVLISDWPRATRRSRHSTSPGSAWRAPDPHWSSALSRPDPLSCGGSPPRSEEHTSELQSHVNLVCRLLLE